MKFEPFSELTKDFSPERWARVEKIMEDMQQEEDRQTAATKAHAGRESGPRPSVPAATARSTTTP